MDGIAESKALASDSPSVAEPDFDPTFVRKEKVNEAFKMHLVTWKGLRYA